MENLAQTLNSWGLSEPTVLTLSKEPEIVADLVQARQQHPLPPGYTPTDIEILFDDVVFIRLNGGQVIYTRLCNPDYQPPFVEWRFDGQCAFFQVGGDVVVNRLGYMAQLDQLMGRLVDSPAQEEEHGAAV